MLVFDFPLNWNIDGFYILIMNLNSNLTAPILYYKKIIKNGSKLGKNAQESEVSKMSQNFKKLLYLLYIIL